MDELFRRIHDCLAVDTTAHQMAQQLTLVKEAEVVRLNDARTSITAQHRQHLALQHLAEVVLPTHLQLLQLGGLESSACIEGSLTLLLRGERLVLNPGRLAAEHRPVLSGQRIQLCSCRVK